MKNIINVVKRFLFVGLAGILLFISTACNQPPTTSASQSSTEGASTTTKGMNRFSDTEKGSRSQYTDDKVKNLVEGSKRNLQKRNASPKEAIDTAVNDQPIKEGARRVSNTAEEITNRPARDLKEVSERGSKNLKENINTAKENIGNAVEDAKDSVKDTLQ